MHTYIYKKERKLLSTTCLLTNSSCLSLSHETNKKSHLLQGLQTFTQYMISLQVFNPEGLGPSATAIVMTDEGGKRPFDRIFSLFFFFFVTCDL